MDITCQRITALIETHFPSDAAFERALGIPEKTVYDWRRGKSKSYRSFLPEIAKLLYTSSAYLHGETDDQTPLQEILAAPDEGQSVSDFAMNFFERYELLARRDGTSPNAVARELGISSGSVTAWKNGTAPSIEKAILLADYFDVTLDYITGRSDDDSPLRNADLTMEQAHGEAKEILDMLVGISKEDRQDLVITIKTIFKGLKK